jgi:hypothetical protein
VKTVRQRIGTGIAATIAGSTLILTPLAADAATHSPTRVCIDNGSAGQCELLDTSSLTAGGGGTRVTARPAPSGRPDAKDNPNFGPASAGRPDAKDNPDFGPASAGRPDAKDNPNYGSATESVLGLNTGLYVPYVGDVTADAQDPVATGIYVPSIITGDTGEADGPVTPAPRGGRNVPVAV